MTHLTLSVLGEFEVMAGRASVQTFESDKVRALLAYLAVSSDHPHRRESLIGLLWPDCPEETARHNLRQALFNLRRALGDHTAKPPYLLISRDSIQFNRESDYSLDVDQFNSLFQEWEKERGKEGADSAGTLLRLEAMVKLYRGAFLQDFFLSDSAEFEDWIVMQREALRQSMLEVLTYLANEYERRGDLQDARSHVSRQLELDPWREEAHYQMMRILARDGQRSGALSQYETCKRMLAEELGVEPSAKTRDLYEQLRSGAFDDKPTSLPNSQSPSTYDMPISLTPFFGRARELEELSRLITDTQCRCITLVGAGGTGKTRLALQAAEEQKSGFAHGAAFVPLASVSSAEAIIPAIADGIRFAFYGPTDPRTQLFRRIRDQHLLLILDNLEHLLAEGPLHETTTELLVQILQEAPQVKLLVTSREAMNLQGEWLYEVQGLPFPDLKSPVLHSMMEFDAVELFVQRATQVRPEFCLDEQNAAGVSRLCSLVEGLPLAIELAATWVRILSPAEIATEIERSLDFLKTQMSDMPERHRSVRAVFDRSWQTLSVDEKQALGSLSIFRGGFMRQAAEEVAGASLPILSSLVMRSLLRRTATGRYDLHELIRQYAAARLAENPDHLQAAKDRHSSYYLGLLEARAEALRSGRQKEVLAELTAEMDNIRAAWDWCVTRQRFSLVNRVSTVLWYVYELHNWWKEGQDRFGNTAEAIRECIQDAGLGDEANLCALNAMLAHSAYCKFRLGRSEEAYGVLASAAPLLEAGADRASAVYPLCYLGIVCWEQGRFPEARESLQRSVELAQVYGERWCEGSAHEFLGIVAHEQGEYAEASQLLGESLLIARGLGDPLLIAHVLSYLGRTLRMQGQYAEAEQALRESVQVAREIDYRSGIGLGLDALALVMDAEGKHDEARLLFSESSSLFREVGDVYRQSRVLNHQGMNYMTSNLFPEAHEAFCTALRMSHARAYVPATLDALAGLADLAAHQRPDKKTLKLAIYIQQHLTSTREAKNLAARIRTELESKLPQADIEEVQQGTSSETLEEFMREALAAVSIE